MHSLDVSLHYHGFITLGLAHHIWCADLFTHIFNRPPSGPEMFLIGCTISIWGSLIPEEKFVPYVKFLLSTMLSDFIDLAEVPQTVILLAFIFSISSENLSTSKIIGLTPGVSQSSSGTLHKVTSPRVWSPDSQPLMDWKDAAGLTSLEI